MSLEVKREENVFVTEINKAREQNKKVYILGAALGAVRIADGLKYRGLNFDAFIVDRDYYEEGKSLLDRPVLCLDEIVGTDCIVLRSIANYPNIQELNSKVHVIDEDVLSLSMVASDPFDLEYIDSDFDKLNAFYESLSDE